MPTRKNTSNFSTWAIVASGLIVLSFLAAGVSAGELQDLLEKSKAFAALPRIKHRGSSGGTFATATNGLG
jgi:hypothetical protein